MQYILIKTILFILLGLRTYLGRASSLCACSMQENEHVAEDPVKRLNRMRSQVNRMCARTKGGKLQVSEDVHNLWLQAGHSRDQLVQMMDQADGVRDP